MPQLKPQVGEVYRHFRGNMYRIQGFATHSETGEILVIYQALYGELEVYARPYESFVEELDYSKYPEATDRYRFTLIPMNMGMENVNVKSTSNTPNANQTHAGVEPVSVSQTHEVESVNVSDNNEDSGEESITSANYMIEFLDTEDFDEKYEILCRIPEREITDLLIDNLAVTLDVVIPEGSIDRRFAELKTCVRTRKKYESLRLR